MRQITAAGRSLIETCEGFESRAYRDTKGIWTIGYGHVDPSIRPGLVWTRDRAALTLSHDLTKVSAGVEHLLGADASHCADLTLNQFSALCALSYNIGLHAFGGSSALNLILGGNRSLVPSAIRMWDKETVNHEMVVCAGLVWRRACECALWALPDGATAPDWEEFRPK
jgi:lysozyme